jgi:hypothetical protein
MYQELLKRIIEVKKMLSVMIIKISDSKAARR